ncbi:beta-N-acetylhexosaminidase [Lacrimispora amygdalina]|uniref:beta-glucosidase n=1 Tax=Lacrimispora amygdalina TaxID=253257 RepID=A0A3E2NI66_9FIRM|nr:glycoside hydrolase family 3 protein [Clostridium indicum]RFZ80697.1 beta-N-acetylhexosaminidase [Clostridium indicum]
MRGGVTGVCLTFMLALTGCMGVQTNNVGQTEVSTSAESDSKISSTSVEDILGRLTLDQKAAQMVQGAVYNIPDNMMKENCYGSILSTFGENSLNASEWKEMILKYQKEAMSSEAGVPYIYGNDAVHGVATCEGTVIYPHNIGIGAANDKELTYQMGLAVADEAKLTGMLWSFSPCLSAAQDPRWGRTYESYSSETSMVTELGTSFTKGLIDGGILPCAKHFFADGNVLYGTGETSDGEKRLIDRGDAKLSDGEIQDLLKVYQAQIDAGVKTIMISHSSVNGTKMHANEKYISMLKNDMGFKGFIVSDWDSIHNIPGDNLKDQTITAINAGIDMLMEDCKFEECRKYIVEAVNEGKIPMDRVNDAVSRILTVKKEMGILDDPMMEKVTSKEKSAGSQQYRDLARSLVEESLVLLKNDNAILPIKKGTKLFVTGPAANDVGVQCGGWTVTWLGSLDAENHGHKWIPEGKTILDGLNELANEYDLTIITDQEKAADADMTLLCLGEKTYTEWKGDSADISITGSLGLAGNTKAIDLAKSIGHPTVALIVAGRNVIISDYMKQWDGIVMCYLPGSEGDGIANVLTGKKIFKGTLPMPYYSRVEDIRTDQVLFPVGYGLKY